MGGALTNGAPTDGAPTDGPRVVLVGPTGVGKTTVGALLAARLGLPYRDTDADVAAAVGRSVAEIFAAEGEEYLREVEERAVAAALAEHAGVLSLGGGAVLRARTRGRLAGRPVVYLSMGPGTALGRLRRGGTRPLLAGDPITRWSALTDRRRPLYTAVARAVVDTDGLAPDQVAEHVMRALELSHDGHSGELYEHRPAAERTPPP
ncbi:shikimate kinase [Streptomyces sp. NRRL F-5123]|uniref:shikimate kinase n=1 Tax=Streptomyces sp. NRRL F-5123 TaxID=1463856 RepID=UPI0007C46775|nr:shikimate kinase [Streptomyces sp. NRRL F-5123]